MDFTQHLHDVLFTHTINLYHSQFSSVQLLSRVWFFVTPQTAACQTSLSFAISRSLLKLMSIKLMMPSNHLIFRHPFSSCPQSFSASGFCPVSQLFISGGQSIGASASALGFPMYVQGWFPLGLTGLISFLSKGFSRVFCSTIWCQNVFSLHH